MRKIIKISALLLIFLSAPTFAAENKINVMNEPPAINLSQEKRLSLPKPNFSDRGSLAIAYWTAGHPLVKTANQFSRYDFSQATGLTAQFSRQWTHWYTSAGISYFRTEQNSAETATALHALPVDLLLGYQFLANNKISPSLHAGLTNLFTLQRGVEESNSSDSALFTNSGLGVLLHLPLSIVLNVNYSRLTNLRAQASEYAGNLWQAGLNFNL